MMFHLPSPDQWSALTALREALDIWQVWREAATEGMKAAKGFWLLLPSARSPAYPARLRSNLTAAQQAQHTRARGPQSRGADCS